MGIKLKHDGYYVSHHKRHPVTRKSITLRRSKIKTKAEADKTFKALIIEMERLIQRQIIPDWESFLMKYDEHLKNTSIAQTTLLNRLSVLRHNTGTVWNHKLVNEISSQDIMEILKNVLGSKSETHKEFFLKTVRNAMEFAISMNYINRNPTPVIRFKISDKIRQGLNEQQIIFLLQKAQELNWPWYPHYTLAVYTGMRNGELYALEWKDICLESRKIYVNKSWNNICGFKATKSGDDRVLEIPAPLLPLLRDLKLKSAGNIFVLPRMRRWDKGEQSRELGVFLKLIGLPVIRFHDLRATWATWLLSKNVPPGKVMTMGGWKQMDTMMIYMRKAAIDIKGATSVLDGISTHGVKGAEIVNLMSR